MFAKNSRYAGLDTASCETAEGREVRVVKLRRLASPASQPRLVKSNDQLDVMAHRALADATKFWHIADANTELQARDLLDEVGRVINAPEKA